MIKKIKIELTIIEHIIIAVIFIFKINIDMGLNKIFFNRFFENPTNLYLKKFFINITEVGNSLWYFIASVLIALSYFFFFQNNTRSRY